MHYLGKELNERSSNHVNDGQIRGILHIKFRSI